MGAALIVGFKQHFVDSLSLNNAKVSVKLQIERKKKRKRKKKKKSCPNLGQRLFTTAVVVAASPIVIPSSVVASVSSSATVVAVARHSPSQYNQKMSSGESRFF
jgi:hypothetical protein